MHLLQDNAIISIIQQWTAPLTITHSDHICDACWNLANDSLRIKNHEDDTITLGHQRVCVYCGRSVLRTRFHLLRTDSQREQRIRAVILEWILPRQIGNKATYLCHSCWVRADRAASHLSSNTTTSNPTTSNNTSEQDVTSTSSSETITLPNYIRPVETESHCFLKGCERKERNRVPVSVRKHLLTKYNYYVPKNNRLCDFHSNTETLDFMDRILDNYINVFTAVHIEDMLQLKESHT
ncbi:unnamed protein product [Colias eurytheme]|nr:unnamed protein product [Colias eurytheme]